MLRAAALALGLAALSAPAAACSAPPHSANAFRQDSFTALPGCDGQWRPDCAARGITAAWYELPTDRYAHGVLGDAIEAGRLTVYTDRTRSSCGTRSATLNDAHVFEDIAPRLADLDGDGDMEVITVRTRADKGAQLAIWDDGGGSDSLRLLATTPYIGRTNRWLAPVGAADLDGDGRMDIAYVDRPHLARELRVVTFTDGRLVETGRLSGYTNHRIGEDFISGGIRDCGAGPEVVVARGDWSAIVALRWTGRGVTERVLSTQTTPAAFAAALACDG